jgi:hypothetical protein
MAAAGSVSVRIGARTYEEVRRLGAQSGRSITRVIEDAVAEEARRAFWQEFHAAVERLRAEPEAWAAYQAEQRELEGTLMDGLDPAEDWTEQFNAPPEAFTFAGGAESGPLEDPPAGQQLEALEARGDGTATVRAAR